MTKDLDNQLVQLLKQTTDLFQSGIEFSKEQLPDVIQQLLTWYLTYNSILMIIGLILLGAQIYTSWYWIIKVEPTISEMSRWMGTAIGVLMLGGIMLIVNLTIFLNFTWLKILIAPKLFLIEYVASLTK